MNREFLLNALFLLLVNVLIKPFYVFGIERTIQDTVGAESYGLYATLFSFTFLLFIVNDFGIHYYNNRIIARHPQLIGKYFPNILVLKMMLSCIYLALVFLAAIVRGFSGEVFYLIFFIALNHVLISLVAFLRSNISGLGLYRTDSAVSTLDKLLLIFISALLLWGNIFEGPFQIEWFVHAQNVSWMLTAILAFLVVINSMRRPLRFRLNLPFLFVILKKSAPFALAVFLMTAYTRLDIVVLEWLLPDGLYQAGVYAAGYRLLDAFNMIGFLFAGLLLPMFSMLLRQQEKNKPSATLTATATATATEEISSLLRLSLQLIWAGTVALSVPSFFFREELMLWLYPQTATSYYGEVMGYLILTLVPFSGIFIYSTLLTANNSLKKMNYLFVGGIAVNLMLNLLLIPELKAPGAAIAALTTQTFILTGQMFLVKKELKLPFDGRQFFIIAGFVLLSAGITWGLYKLPNGGWLLKFAASIVLSLLLAFIFRLIHFRMLASLLKK